MSDEPSQGDAFEKDHVEGEHIVEPGQAESGPGADEAQTLVSRPARDDAQTLAAPGYIPQTNTVSMPAPVPYDDQASTVVYNSSQGGSRWGRRATRIAATAALIVAILFAGVGLGHVIWPSHSSGTSISRTLPTAPSGQGGLPFGNDNGSGSGGSSGSGSGSSSSATTDLSAIASKVSPALVDINVTDSYSSSQGAATGIVLSSDGYVLTNNHVIDGATNITAADVGNGKTYTATVVGYDVSHDIALIKLQGASGLTTARLGDSSSLRVGQAVAGIGNAGGQGGDPSVVGGSVTALDQQIVAGDQGVGNAEQLSGLIQTDANIQSGDSGGALASTDGEVVGVLTAASASNSYYSGSGEGYAVPINTAITIANQIKDGKSSDTVHVGGTAFLGVSVTDGQSGYGDGYGFGYGYGDGSNGSGSGSGATVSGVVSGSPAAQAGLAAGDVIASVDGTTVSSASQLTDLIGSHHPGDKVQITWSDQSGSTQTETVQLASGPAK